MGYVVNWFVVVLFCEVYYFVGEGVVSVVDVDKVVVWGFGLCWGLMG